MRLYLRALCKAHAAVLAQSGTQEGTRKNCAVAEKAGVKKGHAQQPAIVV